MTGNGYQEQFYEGGIVNAYSLALLQALNGRNIPNPLSCIQAEKPFRGRKGWSRPEGNDRYLRSDLFLNLDRNSVESTGLSSYGWRHHNWFEAKFFRASTPNQQQNTADLLADMLRLIALVPDEHADNRFGLSSTGRFLLHVYEGKPEDYLSVSKQTGSGLEPRNWLAPLLSNGRHACDRFRLGQYESDGIMNIVNSNLGDLRIGFSTTTLRIEPAYKLGTQTKQYTFILNRIDDFSIERKTACFSVSADRRVIERPSASQVKSEIQEHVGRWVKTKRSEESKPTPFEIRKADQIEEKLWEIDVAVEDAGLYYNPNTNRLEVTGGPEADNNLDFSIEDALSMMPTVDSDDFANYLTWKREQADQAFFEMEAEQIMEEHEQEQLSCEDEDE